MRKKFYLTLDTETATLPFANDICKDSKQKQKIAIAKPLVYDIGWTITDRVGNIVKKENFLIQETFFVPNVFNTAYYCNKRPIYMDLLAHDKIKVATWNNVMDILLQDLRTVDFCCAYNACFDLKKAIPFTERYIENLYSVNYNNWEKDQKQKCENLLTGSDCSENPNYLKPVFELRGEEFDVVDLWGVACDRLINIEKYKKFCLENELVTASVQFFKTSAETSFQYLMNQHDFIEDHTALSDAEIESVILTKALKKGKLVPQIESFPFRLLGTTFDYAIKRNNPKYLKTLLVLLEEYMKNLRTDTGYFSRILNEYSRLEMAYDNM